MTKPMTNSDIAATISAARESGAPFISTGAEDTAQNTQSSDAGENDTSSSMEDLANQVDDQGGTAPADPEGEFTVAGRKLSWNDAIKEAPPHIATLMKGMQKSYTQKTQDLARQRKDMLREREALKRGADQLKAPEALPDYDPFNEATINARIEAEVSKRLQQALAPMQQEYEVLAAEEQYQAFTSANPDFTTDTALRSEVQAALEANPALDLTTAYWAVKGQRAAKESKLSAAQKAARTRAQREAASVVGTGRRPARVAKPSRQQVSKMSNADILALAKQMNGVR